ncbi:hypothetical protein TM7x_03615 [Candidatus Nanosynbacter lyticus]|uniref:Aminoglycoside phosphotransferase domain-containing protein n=1 Tax=Candidatus Nanosynbacter lyticus TaxID=2093824 RepID=A0A6S4GUT8_9BACT|nr:hypothetical protein [Candidatus Nanosynbacter lyticus]AJA06944.1 hypothetical protein TM7x_03615 [Candidatus Nanosynbacter lyticus]QCT41824.1 hypothetical protein FBF38_03585 [TM7 phylum sp. oral taxon 952]
MEALVNQRQLLTDRALHCAAAELGIGSSGLRVTSVSGGFSRNRRALVSAGDRTIFVKEVDVDVLPDEGERELGWLKKDYEVMRMLQEIHPQYVADQITLSDDGYVLMTTSYASANGWLWQPPEEKSVAERYILAVVAAVRELEKTDLPREVIEELQLQSFAVTELGLDNGIDQIIIDGDIRRQLIDNYQILLPEQSEVNQRRCQKMIELLNRGDELADISVHAKHFAKQPEDCFNHTDVRSDNLAFHPQTGELKLVDWNWASYAPQGSGATEFLIDMARHGQDVAPWLDELNTEMLAAFVGFFLIRSLKPPLKPGDNLRQMQALSAATAYDLLQAV